MHATAHACNRAARPLCHTDMHTRALTVVRLLGELLLAEAVEHVELLGEDGVGGVAAAGELHLHDDLAVGHHHRHATEERLEVLGQLLRNRTTEPTL
eukprot:6185373-Pleurochrysis_carterae.AAC.1